MSRQFKNGSCSCWKDVDKQLSKQETGSELDLFFTFSGRVYVKVATYRTDNKRKPPKTVLASFCPFCGKKLLTEESNETKTNVRRKVNTDSDDKIKNQTTKRRKTRNSNPQS